MYVFGSNFRDISTYCINFNMKENMTDNIFRLTTEMIPLLHRSQCEFESGFFGYKACIPICSCGWQSKPIPRKGNKNFIEIASSQVGKHILEQFRLADPELWAEIDERKK